MITNEVAFVAIAVSDKERARKFYQETLELKPSSTQMDGAWVEYDLGPITIGVGCHPAWKPSRRRFVGWRNFEIQTGTNWWFTSERNDEARMTNAKGSQNAEMKKTTLESFLVVRISSFPRASSFVIRHSDHVCSR